MKKFFIVMGLPRSGTTAVRTALDSHSQITCEYEMFNEIYNQREPWTNEQIDGIIAHLKTVDGLHHNYNLPRLEHRKKVWDFLRETTTHVVLVNRPNLLDVFKSAYFAKVYDQWHNWEGDVYNKNKKAVPDAVTIEASALKKFLREEWGSMYAPMLEEVKKFKSHLVVNYEEFTRYTGRELRRIQEYLEVPFERIVPQTKKFNRQTKITNIDELEEVYARHTLDTTIK